MAVKWAVANGNWAAGATWNDGVVPNNSDDVYLNGYTINCPTTNYTYINAKSISNGENPNTGRTGGILQGGYNSGNSQYRYINANLEVYSTNLIKGGNHDYCYINGNVNVHSGRLIDDNSSWSRRTYITGNVDASGILVGSGVTTILEINGNATLRVTCMQTNTTFTCNGLLILYASQNNRTGSSAISALIARSNALLDTGTISVSGYIHYESTNNTMGVSTSTLNILNPDTFTWKDITEPRVNLFIIVTDADMNNRQQYPPEDEVKQGTEYVWGEKVGTYTPDYPPESVVLKDYEYGDSDGRKTGTMVQEVNVEVGCVTPEDVRKDVPLVGMGVVGSLVVPSVDDVREGVVFDNGSVGTLIVQGGGDRLRIADFGYYTNAQSDTYIVDLTEQDKPKFAVAEERVLIEMFPDLDLDNIPDKYFDDLFVKFLKYRLIVEYYRTAGINSTFTPSEPTTEIVNYQNVRNEVWLNSANIYLKAWSKKYPESITKPQRILL